MILDFTFVHTVTVSTYLGSSTYGPRFADPVTVTCYLQDVVEQVRNNAGDQVVSTAKLNAPLNAAPTTPPVAGQFTAGSRVGIPSGRTTRVLSCSNHDSGALNLGLDHVQVHLE